MQYILSLLLASIFLSSPLFAQRQVPCPKIVANKITGLYEKKETLICFKTERAAEKKDYSPSQPNLSGEWLLYMTPYRNQCNQSILEPFFIDLDVNHNKLSNFASSSDQYGRTFNGAYNDGNLTLTYQYTYPCEANESGSADGLITIELRSLKGKSFAFGDWVSLGNCGGVCTLEWDVSGATKSSKR